MDILVKQAKKLEQQYGSWDKVPYHLKNGIDKRVPDIKDRLANWNKDNSFKGRLIPRINMLLSFLHGLSYFGVMAGLWLLLVDISDNFNGLGMIIIFISLIYLIWRSLFLSCTFCLSQILKIGINKEIQLTSSGYAHTKKGGGRDRRYKNNSYWYHYNEIYPCYNCNRQIIYTMCRTSLPASNNIDIKTSFSYKYNSLFKKVFTAVIILLVLVPIIVEALENPPYERPPSEEIAIPFDTEYNEENYSNPIHDDDEEIKKDTIINTEKLLYQINDPDGWTNMRESPSGKIIRTIDTLERFEIIGENGNWKMILLQNNQQGFIHNSRIIIAD